MRHKICTGAATHTIPKVSRLHAVVFGTVVDTETVAIRHASTDDNICLITCSGTVPFDLDFHGMDFGAKPVNLEVVASGATDILVLYD